MMKVFALLSLLASVSALTNVEIRNFVNTFQGSLPNILPASPFGAGTYQLAARTDTINNLQGVANIGQKEVLNYYVLACLYHATNGRSNPKTDSIIPGQTIPKWTITTDWITNPNYCQWYGIRCFLEFSPAATQTQQRAQKNVLQIEIPDNNLYGSFPAEVALIGANLVTIDMYDNFFLYCADYKWFSQMSALNYLYFGVTSWVADGVPTELNQLRALRELDISNSFWTEGPIRANAFSNLSNLKYLDMADNIYNQRGAGFPSTISALPNLARFYFDNVKFVNNAGATQTFGLSFLSNMPKIIEAWMDFTNFGGTIPTLPQTLQSFSCTYCKLNGPLPVLNSGNSKMNRMWLFGNDLTGTIPAGYGTLDMDFLFLEDNSLSTSSVVPQGLCSQRGTVEGTLRGLGVDCNIQCSRPSCCSCCGAGCGNLEPPTPAPTGPPTPFGICFSGDCEVEVEDKGAIKMIDLALGDYVKVADNKYEPVYSFGHKNAESTSEYLQVATEGDRAPIEISADHMMMVDGDRAVPASMLKKGDLVVTASGEVAAVKSIKKVVRKGAFAPFTESGKIVVNDIVASNYVAFQGSEYLKIGGFETPFSYQWLAHTFNSAHRLAVMMGFRGESYTETGISHWVNVPHKIGSWLLEQNVVVALALLLPAIAIFGLLSIVEAIAKSPVALATAIAGLVTYAVARKNVSVKMAKM